MISKTEHEMTGYYTKSGKEVGLITANQQETIFFYYEPYDGGYRKLGRAESPIELERKFRVRERMGLK